MNVTTTAFNQFIEDLFKGVHNFTSDGTSTLTIALHTAANAPSASADAVLADIPQIAYTNLSSRVLTGVTAEQTGGALTLTANQIVLSASGGAVATFRHFSIYNDDPTSPADPLVSFGDLGSDITLNDGDSLTLTFASGVVTASIT